MITSVGLSRSKASRFRTIFEVLSLSCHRERLIKLQSYIMDDFYDKT